MRVCEAFRPLSGDTGVSNGGSGSGAVVSRETEAKTRDVLNTLAGNNKNAMSMKTAPKGLVS